MNVSPNQPPVVEYPIELQAPKKFVRVAKRGLTWNLPRRFPRYFVDTNIKGMLGNATKWVVRTENTEDPQYLVKYAQKFGKVETLTEFLINQLGRALGFEMANSGIIRLDSELAFLSRIFTGPQITLRHGSLVIEDYYKEEKALEKVLRKEEQSFYSIDFVVDLLRDFCGADFDAVFPKFIEMLVFDALIGSMDRHVQNWGVLETLKKPATYQFAPIFDSARALLWNVDENQIGMLLDDSTAFEAYIMRARPCLGPQRDSLVGRTCNHFAFLDNLLRLYPGPTEQAIREVPGDAAYRCERILRKFPFKASFSTKRKRLIIRIISVRTERLKATLTKGGNR